jgi:chromosome segregation ATPase
VVVALTQDRARKELAMREAALREQFSADLDAQARPAPTSECYFASELCGAAHDGGAASDDEVAAQLEAMAERLAREAEADRAAAEKKHAMELQQALASAAMHEAKCREASEAEKEMSGRLAAAESHMCHLRTELSAKNDTLGWMERTVTGVKEEVAAREAEIRAVYAQKEAARELKVEALQEEHKALTKRLAVLSDDYDSIRQRKDAEMEQLEARVRQTVARKDESIAALREQLSSVHTTLAHTEQVRGSTSAELCAAFVAPPVRNVPCARKTHCALVAHAGPAAPAR